MKMSEDIPRYEFVVITEKHSDYVCPLDPSWGVLFFGRMSSQKHSEGRYIVHLPGSMLRHEFRLERDEEKQQFKFCDGPSAKGTRTITGTSIKGTPEHCLIENDVIELNYSTPTSSGSLEISIRLIFRRADEHVSHPPMSN